MKSIWQNGKMTALGKRMAALALALCFLVSCVQNVAFKTISADEVEAVSGSDAVYVEDNAAEPVSEEKSRTDVIKEESSTTESSTDIKHEETSNSDVSNKAVSDSEIYIDNGIALTSEIEVDDSKLSADSGCTASILYYSSDWSVVYEGGGSGDSLVDGNGTYSVWLKTSNAASGANVLCVDIAGYAAYIEENMGKTINDVIVGDVRVITDTTSIAVTQVNVLYGDIENKGNLRIELYNVWGSTGNSPAIDVDSLNFSEMLKVEFTISGLSEEKVDTPSADEDPQIIMTTSNAVGTKVVFYVDTASGSEVYVDWGNGETVSYASGHIIGVTEGSVIKLYSDDSIIVFDCGVEGRNSSYFEFNLEGVSQCSLTGLNVTNCPSLKELNCNCNELTKIDVSNNLNLTYLNFSYGYIDSIDLSKNTKLESLMASSINLTSINLSKNTKLKSISLSETGIKTLDLTNCPNLESIAINDSSLEEIDLSNCKNLQSVSITGNKDLTSLDFSGNTKLYTLFCENNSLATLNIANCTSLYDFTCNGNKLTYLDASTCITEEGRVRIECTDNLLEEIELPENMKVVLVCTNNNLKKLPEVEYSRRQCTDNMLSFSGFSGAPMEGDFYSPQKNIPIATAVEVDGELDLSSEYNIDGTISVFIWYNAADDSVVTPTTSASGVFTFGEDFVGESLYCVMTNEVFPDLTLTTTEVEIIEAAPELGEPKIIMTTALPVGSSMSFRVTSESPNAPYHYYIDWGDGNIVDCTNSGVTTGNTIKIYSEYDIAEFICVGNQLETISIYDNSKLTYLNCSDNQLTSLDVSGCSALVELNCTSNQLTALDVSKNSDLLVLFCDDNRLNELDLTKNECLFDLYCSNNNIEKLSLNGSAVIENIYCDNNRLTTLDVSGYSVLRQLFCYNNQLATLDFSGCTSLFFVECHDNQLVELNADGTDLDYLWIEKNKLRFSALPILSGEHDYIFKYAPQSEVEIPEQAYKIDLSSEYDINGTITAYTWYNAADDSVVTPKTSENGVFTFGEDFVGEFIYCVMTNEVFPDLTLTTTEVEITEESEEEPEVSDSDLAIQDPDGIIIDAEVEEGTQFEDADGNSRTEGELILVVGNVEDNKKKSVLEAIEAYNNAFNADDNNHAMYDISLMTKKGIKITDVDGRIYIGIKYPDNLASSAADYDFHLYHQKNDGTIEEIEITCKPNGIWFYADDFSPFVLTWELIAGEEDTDTDTEVKGETDSKDPETGDNSAMPLVSAIFTLSFAAMMSFAWYGVKRRREIEN